MIVKQWDKKGNTASFNDIAAPLCKIFKEAMEKGADVYKDGLVWEGFDIGETMKHIALSPDQRFTPENLLHSKIEQGRDVFDEIITLAIQLGIEQGRRAKLREIRDSVSVLQTGFDIVTSMKNVLDQLVKTDEEILEVILKEDEKA